MEQQKDTGLLYFINNMLPIHRLIVSLVIAIITFFLFAKGTDQLMRFMFCWIVFSAAYLIISWIILINRKVKDIRVHANLDDGSKSFVFIMILLSSFSGMLMVLLLMISSASEAQDKWIFLIIAISGMLLSWIMVHTIFTFHYAHLYYDDINKDNKKVAEGLNFPETKEPDYIDFAYFSFVIGCTFQVSDVVITSPKMRRIVLLHGLLAFGLNTFVVALTINLVAGLGK
jgi:uncharacterized membrane protein